MAGDAGSADRAADWHLRPLAETDAAEVLAAFSSDPDMARQGDVRDLASARAYIARLVDPSSVHCAWALARPDDSLAGLVGVSVDEANRSGWMWYWMNAADRGRGRMRRAAAAVAHWALTGLGLHRLELGHRVNNPASRAVALAAGFIQEGRERDKFLIDGVFVDVLTYSRLETDPRPATALLEIVVSSPPGSSQGRRGWGG